MRILHLATFLQGGAGRVIVDLAIHQQRAGHEVAVVTSRTGVGGYTHYLDYLDALADGGVATCLVDSLFTRDYAANLAVVDRLRALYPAGNEPDVIHAHASIPAMIGMLWAGSRLAGVPVVQTMHGWGLAKTPAQAAADVALLNLGHGVAVPSEHSKAVLTSFGVATDRISVIPYGVDVAGDRIGPHDSAVAREMSEARRRGSLVVACVGTIGQRKNQALLVEAMWQVAAAHDVRAWIVGDGDAAALQNVIRDAGLGDRIRVCGYSRHARALAAQADVLVLPSRSEGQPLAILEAFADGVLVVASDIPELSELVPRGVGLTFRSDDAASLAAALQRVSEQPPVEREGWRARARQQQRDRHTVEGMAERYSDFYRERLSNLTQRCLPPAA